MSRTLAALILVAIQTGFAVAAPFVVADVPSPSCDRCVWGGLGGPLVNNVTVDTVRGNAAYGNRVCMRDVGIAIVGSNSITLTCRDSTSVWGDSAGVPFSFARPEPPELPVGLRIAP